MVATLTTVLVLLLDCDRIVVLVVDDCISATVGTDDSEPTPDRTEVNGTNTILGVLGSGGGGGGGGAVVDVDVPVDVNVDDVNVDDVVDVLVDVVAVPVLKGLPFNNFCECDNRLGCRCFFALDGDSSSRG